MLYIMGLGISYLGLEGSKTIRLCSNVVLPIVVSLGKLLKTRLVPKRHGQPMGKQSSGFPVSQVTLQPCLFNACCSMLSVYVQSKWLLLVGISPWNLRDPAVDPWCSAGPSLGNSGLVH